MSKHNMKPRNIAYETMKLLHVTPHYYPAWTFGGTARVAYELTRGLAARGHDVTVFTTDALDLDRRIDGAPGPVDVEGVRVFYFRNRSHTLSARLNLSTPRGMARTARAMMGAFDLVHCHELRTVENLIVTGPAARRGIPRILSPHGTLPHDTGRGLVKVAWDRTCGYALTRRFTGVAALTSEEAAQFRRLRHWLGLPPQRVRIATIPNGVHPADFDAAPRATFRARYGIPPDALLVLCLARLHPRKGAHILGAALRDAPGCYLALVGPDAGARAALAALADAAGVRDRVIFTGYLDGEDKRAALAAADVFALAAVGEGLPMAALEAGAAGLPLLLSVQCYLPEVAETGAGMVLPLEASAWAGAFRRLLTDRALRDSMGRAARALIAARFTWSAVLDRLEAFYKAVLLG